MPAMLSRIHAPSCQAPPAPGRAQADSASVELPRRTVRVVSCPAASASRDCTCSVESMAVPSMAVMMSPCRRPQVRAGVSPSARPTTSTPAAKSLMPTALPRGITVRSAETAGDAHADWAHSERENTAASSHAARRRAAGICRVSYKRLTPDPVV